MSRRSIAAQLATLLDPDPDDVPVDASALPAPAMRSRRAPLAVRMAGLERDDLAGKLEYLSGRALDRADDLLEMDISNEQDEKFGEKVRGLNSAIKTVLQTQVRVDEHRLKARSLDVLPELLAAIKDEEGKRQEA